ncbi:Uncharacterised protein [Vibrio cholerae]|nr:Uncharacterised protein [Vibrio cholerae]
MRRRQNLWQCLAASSVRIFLFLLALCNQITI